MTSSNRYAQHQYPFNFSGTGGEYFRIWTVNIALSLLTLGIYSAWAKVRTKRWLCGHTLLDNQAFAYHAMPLQILKGRLIALAIFIIYSLANQYSPKELLPLVFILLLIAMPWIMVNSLKFNAHNTSYRGIRFRFTGDKKGIAVHFLLLPLLALMTLGIAIPYVIYRQNTYILNHYQYGETPVTFTADAKSFWAIYGTGFLCMIAYIFIFTLVFKSGLITPPAKMMMGIGMLAFYLIFFILMAYFKANIANLTFNNTHIGTVSFISDQSAFKLIYLYLSNLLLVVLTLGLYFTWAKVRVLKYRADHLVLKNVEPLENFTASLAEQGSAAGSELADIFNIDIGFG